MDKKKLEVKLRQLIGAIDTNGKLEEIADYILDNFVSKEEVQNREADLQDLLNDYWEKKLQDSKPRECGNTSKDERPSSPPSICQHEWEHHNIRCVKCGAVTQLPSTPKLQKKIQWNSQQYRTLRAKIMDILHTAYTHNTEELELCDILEVLILKECIPRELNIKQRECDDASKEGLLTTPPSICQSEALNGG